MRRRSTRPRDAWHAPPALLRAGRPSTTSTATTGPVRSTGGKYRTTLRSSGRCVQGAYSAGFDRREEYECRPSFTSRFSGLAVSVHGLGSEAHVVDKRANEPADDGQIPQPFQRSLPERNRQRNGRVTGQAVEFGAIAEREHRHDARAAHPGRIVHGGLAEARGLELRHALVGHLQHLVLGAKLQAGGGAGLDASGFQAHRDAIHAQRALVNFLGPGVEPGDVERAAGDAVPAPDAVLLLEIHQPVVVLHDRARRGTSLQASRIGAVHALVLAHQPVQPGAVLVLVELDQVPEVPRRLRHGLVGAHLNGRLRRQIVPLLAGDFAGLAADTRAGVNQLADDGRLANAGRRRGSGGNSSELKRFPWHGSPPPTPSPASRGSPCLPVRTSWGLRWSGSPDWPGSLSAPRGRGSPSGWGIRSGKPSCRPPSWA